jgi:hypothetical protein
MGVFSERIALGCEVFLFKKVSFGALVFEDSEFIHKM